MFVFQLSFSVSLDIMLNYADACLPLPWRLVMKVISHWIKPLKWFCCVLKMLYFIFLFSPTSETVVWPVWKLFSKVFNKPRPLKEYRLLLWARKRETSILGVTSQQADVTLLSKSWGHVISPLMRRQEVTNVPFKDWMTSAGRCWHRAEKDPDVRVPGGHNCLITVSLNIRWVITALLHHRRCRQTDLSNSGGLLVRSAEDVAG